MRGPDPPELAAFLGGHTPFQSMPPDELAALAADSVAVDFPTGAVVADYRVAVPDDIWMVRTGHVALLAGTDGAVLDGIGPGGIFGYMPLLSGGGMDFLARATEPSTLIRLPGAPVRAQFARPAGLAFLASSAWSTGSATSSLAATTALPAPDSRPVSELVHGGALVTAPDTSIRDVVSAMTERQVSSAVIRLPDGELAIFTDRDLRERVVAAGLPLDAAVAEAMSTPARRVDAAMTAEAVLMEMLESGLRHMPVVTARGEVLGVVEDADLLAASARQGFALRHAIGLARDADELSSAARRVTAMAVDLFRGGIKAAATSSILAIVIDTLVRRALELTLAGTPEAPRGGFAWLTLGSVARREAMPSSDVDSALSWRPELTSAAPVLRSLAHGVHELLDRCGLPPDRNGAIAAKAGFARSSADWAAAADGWLEDPLRDRGLILSSLLLDARVVWGDGALHTVPARYRGMRVAHPNALRLQLLDALSGRVRTRSLRDVLARRGGTFDFKSHAVTPIVNLARWGGLTAGVTSASTPARLSAAAAGGALTERDAAILTEAFVTVQRMRMAHQVDQLVAGHTPGDVIAMSELSPLNRSLLGDAVREIAAVRRRVGNFGNPSR